MKYSRTALVLLKVIGYHLGKTVLLSVADNFPFRTTFRCFMYQGRRLAEILAKMYRGLVEPHFSYCCSVWGNCSKPKIDSLQRVQNRAARIVMNSGHDASTAPLIQSLGWSTISNLIHKETATLIYKSLNDLAPGYMRNLFARCSESNGRVLRSTDTDLKLPLLKTSAGQKSFSYRGARLWNSLSREAKVATSLSAFNRLSKNDVDTLNQS